MPSKGTRGGGEWVSTGTRGADWGAAWRALKVRALLVYAQG